MHAEAAPQGRLLGVGARNKGSAAEPACNDSCVGPHTNICHKSEDGCPARETNPLRGAEVAHLPHSCLSAIGFATDGAPQPQLTLDTELGPPQDGCGLSAPLLTQRSSWGGGSCHGPSPACPKKDVVNGATRAADLRPRLVLGARTEPGPEPADLDLLIGAEGRPTEQPLLEQA